jgi:poly [ADP-ribose] polymerase
MLSWLLCVYIDTHVTGCSLFLIAVVFIGIKNEGKEDEELQQSSSKAGAKRRKDISGEQKSKVAKSEDVSTSRAASAKNDSELDSELESQSKELWALKDDLKKHVTTVELRAMLEANSQISNGSELDLRDRW